MGDRYRQCELTRPQDGGLARMVSWIPESVAMAGAVVRLKDPETGAWTAGWTVVGVSEPALPARLLERQSRDHLRTRKASDV
jgi:hypothetical protein